MKPFYFEKTGTVSEALNKKSENGQYIAGGTNLVDLMKKNITLPDRVIDVTSGLSSSIERVSLGIKIGAMVRNSVMAGNSLIVSAYPLLVKAVLAGASPQIRNMASVGGNLLQRTRCPYFYDTTTPCNKRDKKGGCGAREGLNRMSAIIGQSEQCVAVHPSDLCVGLAALDAIVNVEEKDGKKTKINFKDFHKLPESTPWLDNNLPEGALITSVEVPDNAFNKHYAYIKLRDRDSYAFALVSVAAALDLENGVIKSARLASGGVAHKPWRWYAVEKFLEGKSATSKTFKEAAEIVKEGLQPLSGNAFKVPLLKGAIETALNQCLTP